jgi:broad specificity phosphatase PhoE
MPLEAIKHKVADTVQWAHLRPPVGGPCNGETVIQFEERLSRWLASVWAPQKTIHQIELKKWYQEIILK